MSKDVADPRTRHNVDTAGTHPRPNRHLNVLASPYRHTFVEGAEPEKEMTIDGHGATNRCRCRVRMNVRRQRRFLLRSKEFPHVVHRPSEATASLCITIVPSALVIVLSSYGDRNNDIVI